MVKAASAAVDMRLMGPHGAASTRQVTMSFPWVNGMLCSVDRAE